MPSFGEKLKLEREKRKITLEQISASTKIGTRMLQALEEDKFNQLPGGIFNKGFVRSYSRFVGLDEDQTVADYLAASGDAPPPSVEIVGYRDDEVGDEESVHRLEGSSSSRQIPRGVLAGVLLVVAIALFVWNRHRREHSRELSVAEASPTPTQSIPVLEPSHPAATPPAVSQTAKPSVTATTNLRSPTATPTALTPAPLPGEFTVSLKVREQSWISTTVDGSHVSSELLEAGNDRTFHGQKQISVKAGNAGGVEFLFNGKKVDVGGDFGEVKTITFGLHGMLPPPPSPPATP